MVSRAQVFEVLQENVIDPELGINIVDLGLVYRVEIGPAAGGAEAAGGETIEVSFTLTYPGCPLEEIIREDIVKTLSGFSGLPESSIRTRLVWEPRWGPEFMSEEARVSLGYPI